MGLSASKKVSTTLEASPALDSACDAAYEDCLNKAQHAFPGVRPYQLSDAALSLHLALSESLPLVKQWAPSPPSQAQVDRAIRAVMGEGEMLDRSEFKAFAVGLFADVIVSNARDRVIRRIPIGVAGIAGLGAVTRSNRGVVGFAVGAYALGVAAFVYLSLS